VAVTTLGRTQPLPIGFVEPRVDVVVDMAAAWNCIGPVGVFGRYRSLTLAFAAVGDGDIQVPPANNITVLAQDLVADGPAVDVTARVQWQGTNRTVAGDLIDAIGLAARSTPDDMSPPGLVLVPRQAV